MSFFNNEDPFEDIIREFFGSRNGIRSNTQNYEKRVIKGEEENRKIDFIETINKIYLIFELPGYNEKEIIITIKGKELQIKTTKKLNESVQKYLIEKLNQGLFIKKNLPKFVNAKKFEYTMKNGILEISFNKK